MVSQAEAARDYYIASMTEHDLLEVVQIEEQCGLSRWGWDAYHAELALGRDALMFVARPQCSSELSSSYQIIGFIAARVISGEVHINNVAVRQQYRRQGIALKLLQTVLQKGAETGAATAFLEVRAGNIPAQKLYSACGFQAVGRRAGYYTEPREDAIVMRATQGSLA